MRDEKVRIGRSFSYASSFDPLTFEFETFQSIFVASAFVGSSHETGELLHPKHNKNKKSLN